MQRLLITTLCLFLLAIFSCKNDPTASLDLSLLKGRWEVASATRNDRPTGMLNGTFFKFENGQITTNLPQESEASEVVAAYEVVGKEIVQKSTPEVRYTIEQLTSDNLGLRFVVRGMTFILSLKPAAEPPAMPTDSTEVPQDSVSSEQ
jgi:hypothetical protein